MGKRSDFKRIERDYYRTPKSAVVPLVRFLKPGMRYYEPCAGDGALVRHLEELSGVVCAGASDIEPQHYSVDRKDAFEIDDEMLVNVFADMIITNPPWDRKILHPLINHFVHMGMPVWLLFDADWAHTKQAAPFLEWCSHIVSIGRVKWIENSKMTGKDNCAWYRFEHDYTGPTCFYGRQHSN